MKRILFLMVLFCMGILSGFAKKDNFSYTDGNGVTWGGYVSYDYETQKTEASINTTSCNSEEVVVIPDEITYAGEKYKVTKLGSVFSGNKIIEKVTIPKTVISLSSTFYGCSALSEVVNTNQLKSVSYAFGNCSSLKSIDLSSCEILGSGSFDGCSQLENVVLKVCKRIDENAFFNHHGYCQKLKSIGDISHCESIGDYAFEGCSSLTSVDLSNCKTIGISSFSGCSALESVGSTKLLANIPECAFNSCSNLQSIDLSNCTSIGRAAFVNCYKLKHLNLNKCTNISSSAFKGCGIEEIDLSSVKTIEDDAFSYCSSLTKVTGLKLIKSLPGGVFYRCNNLHSVDFPPLLERIGSYAFQSCALDSISLPGLTNIDQYAFSGCSNLKEVKVPSTLESVGDKAFEGCSKLNDVFTYTILPVKINQNSN